MDSDLFITNTPHQALTGARAPLDFMRVPGHGQEPRAEPRVPGAPEGEKRAEEYKKREDGMSKYQLRTLLTYLLHRCSKHEHYKG